MGRNYKLKLFKEHGLTKRQVSDIIREENNIEILEENKVTYKYYIRRKDDAIGEDEDEFQNILIELQDNQIPLYLKNVLLPLNVCKKLKSSSLLIFVKLF